MPTIWRLALANLLVRRGRSLLLSSAVAFATALVTALACGLATAERNVSARIDRLMGTIDVRIVHPYSPTFEASMVDEVRGWPEVESVAARLGGSLTLVHADGRTDDDGRPLRVTVQARGSDFDSDRRLNPLPILEGRAPEGPGELAVDPRTQRALRTEIGDRLQVQRLGDPIELVVVGVYDRPALGALQRPLVQLDRATLAEATGSDDRISAIVLNLRDGVDTEQWCERNAHRVRDPLILEPAERVRTGLDRQAAGAGLAFTIVCMVGFMSCAFIVGTGLTTALAEQIRELGMLRTIGASRARLAAMQLASGFMVAGAGAIVGVPLGIALTALGAWIYRDLLPAGLTLSPSGMAIAVGGALASGVAGALVAAIGAVRVTPLEAIRIRAAAPRPSAIVWVAVLALACAAAQLALTRLPDRDDRFWAYVLVGIPLEHAAWFLLSVPVLLAIARLASTPLERTLGLPRGLLAGAVARAPFRLGLTAGALMVGVSIMVSVWSNGLALLDQISERVRFADAFVFQPNGIPPAEQSRLRDIPGVRAAVPIGYLPVRLVGQQVFGATGMGPPNVICVGFDPEEFLRLNRLEWIEGSPESALPALRSGEGVLVAKEFLTARGLSVGDRITLGGAKSSHAFEIAGVVSSAGLDVVTQYFGIRTVYMEQAVSCVFMDFDAVARWFDSRDAFIMQMDLGPDADERTERSIADRVAEVAPGAVFTSGRAIKQTIVSIGHTMLTISSAVAVAALLLASFGVANVVAAGIASRKREFGVLRAVGGSSGTVARVVLGETALVALAAIATGCGLGLHLAWMGTRLYRDMAGLEIDLVLPWLAALGAAAAAMSLALGSASLALRSIRRATPRALLANE